MPELTKQSGSLSAGENADNSLTSDTPAPRVRVPGLTGLEHRGARPECAIFPKGLVSWCGAITRHAFRDAASLPALYFFLEEDGSYQLSAPTPSNTALVRASRRRLTVAQRRAVPRGEGLGEEQNVLRPRHLHLLGHLIAALKYQVPGTEVCKSRDGNPSLHISPGALVDRLGYSRSGDSYNALEADLCVLAQFLIKLEARAESGSDEWQTISSSPLLQAIETGCVSVDAGIMQSDAAAGSRVKRNRLWSIGFGWDVLRTLKTKPSDLAVLYPALWRSAGRDVVSQWMSLYFTGHGFDASTQIHGHRLETLADRMLLTTDSLREKIGARQDDLPRATLDLFDKPPGKRASSDWETSRQRLSRIRAGQNRLWRRINQAVSRLSAGAGLASIEIQKKATDQLSPSQRQRRYSGSDHLKIRRWHDPIERIAGLLPRWVKTDHRDLLALANQAPRPMMEVGKSALSSLVNARPSRWLAWRTRWLTAQVARFGDWLHHQVAFRPIQKASQSPVIQV